MKYWVRRLLTTVDIFGYPVTLNYQNSTKFKSQTGGLFSLLTIGLVFYFMIGGVLQLVQRQNSTITEQQYMKLDPQEEVIGFDQFTFFIDLNFDSNNAFKPIKPIFTISLLQQSYLNRTLETTNIIRLVQCQRSYFEDVNNLNYTDQFDLINMGHFLCPESSQKFNLAGILSSAKYEKLEIVFSECSDSTQCYTTQELRQIQQQSLINHAKITIGFTNSFLNVQDSQLQPIFQINDFLIDLTNVMTKVDVQLVKTQFFDDQSILPLQNDIKSQIFYNANEYIKVQSIHNSHSSRVAEIHISLSQTHQDIHKTYDRFDTFLAYMGGILQSILFFMTFIIGYYNMLSFYVSLANYLYTFDLKINDETQELDSLKQRVKERITKVRRAVFKVIKSVQNFSPLQKYGSRLQSPKIQGPSGQSMYKLQIHSPTSDAPDTFHSHSGQTNNQMVYNNPLNTISPVYKDDPFSDGVEDRIQAIKYGKIKLRASKEAHQDSLSLSSVMPDYKVRFQQEGSQEANRKRGYNMAIRKEVKTQVIDFEVSNDFRNHITNENNQPLQTKMILSADNQTLKRNPIMRQRHSLKQMLEDADRQSEMSINFKTDTDKQKDVLSMFSCPKRSFQEKNKKLDLDEFKDRRNTQKIIIDPTKIRTEYHSRKEFLQCSIEDVMKYSKRIKMSFLNFVSWLCCRNQLHVNEKINLIDRAVRMLKRDTDITSILYKLHDIDKLKKLLLSKDQNMLFNYTPKPVIKVRKNLQKLISVYDHELNSNHTRQQTLKEIEDDLKFISKKQRNKSTLLHSQTKFESMKSFFKLYQAFDRLHQLNKNGISQNDLRINTKLMHLIGEDLKTVFEASYFIEEQAENNEKEVQISAQDISNVSFVNSNLDEESVEL